MRDERLVETLKHLYDNAPAFKNRVDAAGLNVADLESADSLAQLPILRKDDLVELQRKDPPFGGMLGVPMSELNLVFQSPGPINEPGATDGDVGRWAPALAAAGFKAGDVAINAFGYHLTPAGLGLQASLHACGCVVIPGGIGNMDQQIQAMAAFSATGYVGLPSYLKALLDKAEAMGVELQLKNAFVLAEPLPPSLKKLLNDRGIGVYQGYGTAECGALGYDVDGYAGWRIPDGTIVQICDINSGEPLPAGEVGEVVATLYNKHYAIIRFGVGDLSAIMPESLTDGGGPRLAGWLGRVGAATKVRGMFLHPTQLGAMMRQFAEVAAYQAVITREDHRDNLAIEIVVKEGADADTLTQRIVKAARDAIKFNLTATIVDTLPEDAPPIRDTRDWDE